MRWITGIRLRLKALAKRRQLDRDLEEEVRFHLAMRQKKYEAAGWTSGNARAAARRRFGNTTSLQEECREMWTFPSLESFGQDLRYGMRQLRRSPGFTVVAVLALALGIGANTAIFSLMNAVMLRTLPVRQPDRLVLFGNAHAAGSTDDFPNGRWNLFSFPMYQEIAAKNHVFSGVTAVLSLPLSLHGIIGSGHEVEPMNAQLISGTYFSVLGVHPSMGRSLTAADDTDAGAHPVAVISDSWWTRRFAQDPKILGKKLTIGSTVYTIIGVTPPGFFGTTVGESTDLWIPLSMQKQVSPGWNGLNDKFFQSLYLLARLKPGVSIQQAGADTTLLFKQILEEYAGPQPSPERLKDIQHASIAITSAATGLSRLRFQFSMPLRILMVVVGLVLLICCANIANLLLARASARQREITVRQALGAPRSRLIRQLLTECLLLAVIGGTAGIALAWWASHFLLSMVSTGTHVLPLEVSPDAKVLAFTLILTLVTAILFGAAPAFVGTRVDLNASLKEGRGSGVQTRSPLAKVLIAAQVAISLVLLVGAGLFLRSLMNLTHVETGFDQQNVLEFNIDEASSGYKEDARLGRVQQQIEQRVSAQPGVHAASFSFFTFNEGGWTGGVSIYGAAKSAGKRPSIAFNVVGNDYFRVMGIPLLAGRWFGTEDTGTSQKVAVINQTMARMYFPNESPIGHRFGIGGPETANDLEIVGVVKDAKYFGLREKPMPAAYLAHSQHIQYLGDFEVRYSGDPRSIIAEVRRAIADVDHTLPVSSVTTMVRKVNDSMIQDALVAQLSTFFGLLAVFLACIGLYGLMSYMVARRTSEIGVRMALGAGRRNVMWMVMKEVLMLTGIGLVAGIPVALAGDRLIASMLFGLKPTDPFAMGSAVVLMLAVAALAGYLPARQAARVSPIEALRYE